MRILISNDDGINAQGLRSLHDALAEAGHELWVAAPSREQSAVSSAISSRRPLFATHLKEEGFEGWAVDGTPADCVMLALNGLFPPDFSPDMVISGINRGPNVGMDVLLSGTVGAAAQGALTGLPALALSHADVNSDCREQAAFAASLISRLGPDGLPGGRVWNLNFPACPLAEVKGLKICEQSVSWPAVNRFEQRSDPYGRPYWWAQDAFACFRRDDPGTDKGWLHRGYVTLTPLRFDFTDRESLGGLDEILLDGLTYAGKELTIPDIQTD